MISISLDDPGMSNLLKWSGSILSIMAASFKWGIRRIKNLYIVRSRFTNMD